MKVVIARHYNGSGTSDISFTGMNQDTISNLYDFPAREYGIQGRWPSPDPAGMSAADPTNPQSWNLYAYILNSPLTYLDPTGLRQCAPNTTNQISGKGGPCSGGISSTMTPGDFPMTIINGTVGGALNYASFGGAIDNGDGSFYLYTYDVTLGSLSPNIGDGTSYTSGGFSWNLGIRAPGQTFHQCIKHNATNYSVGGAFDISFGTTVRVIARLGRSLLETPSRVYIQPSQARLRMQPLLLPRGHLTSYNRQLEPRLHLEEEHRA